MDGSGKGISPEQRERDGRLAWLIVGACALLSLTLIVLGIMALRGPAARWAEESMRETREQAMRDRARDEAWQSLPVPPTASAPRSEALARPIGSVAGWIGPDDYPSGALRRGEQGRARVTVFVNPEGRANGCRPLQSSGSWSLDTGTCDVMMRKGRWDPAPQGVEGVREWNSPAIRWVLPD